MSRSGFPSSRCSVDRTKWCSRGRYFILAFSGGYRAIPHIKPTTGHQTWRTVHLCGFKLFGEGSSHSLCFAPQPREVNRKELLLSPCVASCSGVGDQAAIGSGCGSLGDQEKVQQQCGPMKRHKCHAQIIKTLWSSKLFLVPCVSKIHGLKIKLPVLR